jgi:hypothetical protein
MLQSLLLRVAGLLAGMGFPDQADRVLALRQRLKTRR